MKNQRKTLSFYEQMENLIPVWDTELQRKMNFAKDYLNSMTTKDLKSNRISLGPMDERTLQFLIFSILLEYDRIKETRKAKRNENDTYYMDAEEIFPIENITLEEVEFLKHCFEKIHVDINSEDDEVIVLDKNQLLFLLIGIMREYNTSRAIGGENEE